MERSACKHVRETRRWPRSSGSPSLGLRPRNQEATINVRSTLTGVLEQSLIAGLRYGFDKCTGIRCNNAASPGYGLYSFVILIEDGSAYIAVFLVFCHTCLQSIAICNLRPHWPALAWIGDYIRAACMLGQRPTAAVYDVNSAPWLSLSLLTCCPYCAAAPRCTVCRG